MFSPDVDVHRKQQRISKAPIVRKLHRHIINEIIWNATIRNLAFFCVRLGFEAMKQQHESVNVWFAARITRPTSGGFEMVGESERERGKKN